MSVIYHEASARFGAARHRYVREVCAGDDEIRREIEALLAADGEPAIVDGPALDAAAPAMAGDRTGVRTGWNVPPRF
jgi:hypothetical protein